MKDGSRKSNKRDSNEIARDRYLVAGLHAKGMSLHQIANELNNRHGITYTISPSTVSRDYQANIKVWREKALIPTAADVEEQLVAVRQTKLEAWAAWERSKEDAEQIKEIQELQELVDADPPDTVLVTKTIETLRKGQVGNDRFLKIVIDCIDRESKLKGLYTDRVHLQIDKTEEITYKMYSHVSPVMWNDPSIEVIDGTIYKDGKPVTIINGEVIPLLEEGNAANPKRTIIENEPHPH